VGDHRAVEEVVEHAYAHIEPAPIDTAVMEKLDDLRVIPVDVGWADLGTWQAVFEALPKGPDGNAQAVGPEARTIVIDSHDSLIWAEDGSVAVVGLDRVAVVSSAGGFLVCPLERVEEVRAVVDQLRLNHPRAAASTTDTREPPKR
jgi:mannose-1-phosphate guanylyltransferase